MANIPTLTQLRNDIIASLESQYSISISPTGKVFLRIFAGVLAGVIKLFYLSNGKIQKNIFVDTADPESMGGTLERFGIVKLGRRPFPPTAGQYTVVITGEIGAVIPASTTFKSDDSSLSPNMLFILDDEYELVAETDTITLRALTAGVISKLNELDTLTVTAPLILVDSSAYVSGEVIEPRDAEDIEAYRTAVINAYQLEAQGGAATDYRLWAADAQGVLRVYPYAKSGVSSEIDLFVEATVADSIDGRGTPSGALLSDVEDVVNFDPDTTKPLLERGRRPLTAIVNYLQVEVKEVDIEIVGYVGITTAIQTLIDAALTEMVNEIRPFVAAADILENKNDILDVNKIISVILASKPGSIFTSIVLRVDGDVVSTNTFTDGDIPFLNSVTYA